MNGKMHLSWAATKISSYATTILLLFRAWNIQSSLAFDIPKETHCYLVHDFFCKDLISLKRNILQISDQGSKVYNLQECQVYKSNNKEQYLSERILENEEFIAKVIPDSDKQHS